MTSSLRMFLWIALAPAAIGGLTGACVAGLIAGVELWGLARLAELPGIVPALFAPLGLVLTYAASKYVTRAEKPATSELYITLYHKPDATLPLEQVPGRLLATAATVGFGGSQGFESTSALVGAAWGDSLARACRLDDSTKKSLWAAGASAGIAAVFSSPAAGALYGIEIPFKRGVDAKRLIPCVFAAVGSYAVRGWLIGEQRIVTVHSAPTIDGRFLVALAIVALLCGAGARLFVAIEDWLRSLSHRQPRFVRALVGGVILSMLAVAGHRLCGQWITFASGYVATGWMEGGVRPIDALALALVIRASANLVTVYGGGGGGVFTSLAANGALLGEIIARALGCDGDHALALFGAACFLGAAYRLPLALMAFIAEATIGPAATAAGLAAIALSYTMMGDKSVSEAQTDEDESPPMAK